MWRKSHLIRSLAECLSRGLNCRLLKKKEIMATPIRRGALRVIKFTISKISPNKLYVKGPPKLATHNINHSIDIAGKRFSIPLF